MPRSTLIFLHQVAPACCANALWKATREAAAFMLKYWRFSDQAAHCCPWTNSGRLVKFHAGSQVGFNQTFFTELRHHFVITAMCSLICCLFCILNYAGYSSSFANFSVVWFVVHAVNVYLSGATSRQDYGEIAEQSWPYTHISLKPILHKTWTVRLIGWSWSM